MYGAVGGFALFLNISVIGYLFGLGKTRLTLLINFRRVVLFRIPVMAYMQRLTSHGPEAAGIVMMISNSMTSLLALVVLLAVTLSDRRKKSPSPFQSAEAGTL